MFKILHIPTTLYINEWSTDEYVSVYSSIENAEAAMSEWTYYMIATQITTEFKITSWIWPGSADEFIIEDSGCHKFNRHEFEIVEVVDV